MSNKITRHVGTARNTGSRVYVVWRSLPDEPDMALIVYRDGLPGPYADPIHELVMGRGQQHMDLYTVMDSAGRLDGGNMLTVLHKLKYLHKVPTNIIDMHVGGEAKISLDVLNARLAEQSASTISAGQTKAYNPMDIHGDDGYPESTGVVAQLLADAAKHKQVSDSIYERAYTLDPSLRPAPTETVVNDPKVLTIHIPVDATQAKAVEMVKQVLREYKAK